MTEPVVRYQRGTQEYVRSSLTEAGGADLSGDTVVMAIYKTAPSVWLPATWDGDTVRTTDPVLFDTDHYPEASYSVAVKVTDSPEVPIVKVGRISIGN